MRKKHLSTAIMLIGVFAVFIGIYVFFHYSTDVEWARNYPPKSQIGKDVAIFGVVVFIIGFGIKLKK